MPDFLVAFCLLVALMIVVIIFVWVIAAIRHRYRCKKHEWELLVTMKRNWVVADDRPSWTVNVYACKNCGKLFKLENKP
jgi:heme/copper-type cytochrome/quinol oxidase subunit 2